MLRVADRRTYRGHDGEYLTRELELGKRVAVLIGNEATGWGPWLDTRRIFNLELEAVNLHQDWLPHPHPSAWVPRQRQAT